MFDQDMLSVVLLALATGYPARAEHLVASSDQLDDVERKVLSGVLDSTQDPSKRCRAIGDVLRVRGDYSPMSNECYRTAFYLGSGVADMRGNELFDYFSSHRAGRVLDKWVHYFPIYTRHLEPYRNRPVRILEVGVYRGGSLDMWESYFGPQATLIGIDIDENAQRAAGPNRTVELGDQTDADFLREVSKRHGPFDVVIDDGGHEMRQQIVTAKTMFPLIADGGIMLTEDTHTSYWKSFGADTNGDGTFMEWSKTLLDVVNGYHQNRELDDWVQWLDAIHCYDSVVVLERKKRFAPFSEQVGHAEFTMQSRSTGGLVSELLATRDAAAAEVGRLKDARSADAAALNEELRLLRAELSTLRPHAEQLRARLDYASSELNAARRLLRAVRRHSRRRRDNGES